MAAYAQSRTDAQDLQDIVAAAAGDANNADAAADGDEGGCAVMIQTLGGWRMDGN